MRGQVALAVVGLLIAAAVLLVHLFGLGFACGLDTSYCASSSEKNGTYQGQMFTTRLAPDPSGEDTTLRPAEPYANGTVFVSFESREDDHPPVPFHTDATGQFCIAWAQEDITPFIRGEGEVPLLVRYPPNTGYLGAPRFDGALRYWEPGVPGGCEESSEGIPWNRADDLASSWQSWLLIILPLSAAALLLASIARRRLAIASRLRLAGLSLVAASAIALVVLWGFV